MSVQPFEIGLEEDWRN